MIRGKVDADSVIKGFKRTIDLTQNFAPLFMSLLGTDNDKDRSTIKGGILESFSTKRSPEGKAWDPLSPKYFEAKQKKYPGKPTLQASGALFDSLVKKTESTVRIIEPRKLTYGTLLPYAKFLQMGTEHMPSRAFMGFRKDQREAMQIKIAAYMKATIQGRAEA